MQKLLILFLVGLALHSKAQSNNTGLVQNYNEKEGLISPDCTHLLTDSLDNIWLCSFQSVSRFNGRTFVNYDQQHGLNCTAVYGIDQDEQGIIYAFTDRGVYHYTGDEQHPFAWDTAVPDTIMETMLPISPGEFWFGGGIVRGIFHIVNKRLYKVPGIEDQIIQIEKSNDGFIYAISREQHVFVFRGSSFVGRLPVPFVPEVSVNAVRDKQGNIWYMNGHCIYRFKGLQIAETIVRPPDKRRTALFCIGQQSGHIFLIKDDIFRYQQNSWTTIRKPDAVIYDFLEDRSGTLWVGTMDKGLYRIQPDPLNRLQQLRCFTTHQQQPLLQRTGVQPLPEGCPGFLHYTLTTSDKIRWFCTTNGLYYQPGSKGALKRYVAADTTPTDVSDKIFLKAVEGRNGTVWFGSYNGVDRYQNGTFTHFNFRQGLFYKAIYDIAIDGRGELYIGINGLSVYRDGRFSRILTAQTGNSLIWSLCCDAGGNLWAMNLSGGLYCVKQQNGHFYAADSLILKINGQSPVSKGFGFDKNHHLWFATKHYFFVFAPDARGRYSMDRKQVIKTWLEEQVKMLPGTDGYLYLYDRSGSFFQINTDSVLLAARTRPSVSIPLFTALRLPQDDAPTPDTVLSLIRRPTREPLGPFAYWQNDLRFSFTANAVSFPEEVYYRYRLLGYDTGWQASTPVGEATYNNLKPGSYALVVQAADVRQQWSKPAICSFTIQAPWYRSWWAYVLALATAAGFSFLLFSWGVKQSRKKAQFRHLLIEQQLKAIRAQINPHFLHNMFAFLATRIHYDRTAASFSLETLSHYIREVLYASDKSIISLEEELASAEKYLQIQQLILPAAFQFEIRVDDQVDTFGLQVPSMLLQPILENACKYGIDSRNTINQILVTVQQSTTHVCCAITDSGNTGPRAEPGQRASRGLKLTTERLRLLYRKKRNKPRITKEPHAKGGTIICIYLPLE